MLDKLLILAKKYIPTILKLLYKEAKRHDFNKNLIKKNLLKDTQLFITEQLKVYMEDKKTIRGYFGTIQEEELEGGEIFFGSTEELPTIPYTIHEFSQLEFSKEFSRNLCFGYGNLGVYADNLNYNFTITEQKILAERFSKTPGFISNKEMGGYFSEGEKVVADYMEENKFNFRKRVISTKGDNIYHILNKNYSIAIGVKLSQEILDGLRKDGILTRDEVKGAVKYGHLLRIKIKKSGTLFDVKIIDNYSGDIKNNTYDVEQIKEFLNSSYVYSNARFVIPDIEEEKNTEDIFLKDSKYKKFIEKDLDSFFKFDNYKDKRPANISDVKELITLYDQKNK